MNLLNKSILIILIFVSCKTTKHLAGKTFNYNSKKRTLQLIFDNDSICRLRNVFYCNDIDEKLKEITIHCQYERLYDTLYVKNINCGNDDSCKYDLFYSIPPQISKQCSFLSEEKRANIKGIGPKYLTDYEKYGLVPNIDIDTLYIVKNRIILMKHNENLNFWFVFR
jgi:hypothetical protein